VVADVRLGDNRKTATWTHGSDPGERPWLVGSLVYLDPHAR
jgi:hypothetical protein